jgi:hypothetical protein
MSKKIPIRIDFEGEDAKRFNAVKETRGVKANNELIRLLIADAYNQIEQKKQHPVEVPAQ